MQRFTHYMGWTEVLGRRDAIDGRTITSTALPLTAYNAITPIEAQASKRLADLLLSRPGGKRLHPVLWAASGSEAIQKALWTALARDRTREMIVATRFGFHGKKGLAGAVTGSEADRERDPRVRFISFPMKECADVSVAATSRSIRLPYRQAGFEALKLQFGRKINRLDHRTLSRRRRVVSSAQGLSANAPAVLPGE